MSTVPAEFFLALKALKEKLPRFAGHFTDRELMEMIVLVADIVCAPLLERGDEP